MAQISTAQATLVAGALIAASILAHALITKPGTGAQAPPARYQVVHLEADGSRVARLDTRTGEIFVCGGAPEMQCGPWTPPPGDTPVPPR